jgi:hypothetical protein
MLAKIHGATKAILSLPRFARLIIAIILAMFQPEILAIVLVLASSLAAAGA